MSLLPATDPTSAVAELVAAAEDDFLSVQDASLGDGQYISSVTLPGMTRDCVIKTTGAASTLAVAAVADSGDLTALTARYTEWKDLIDTYLTSMATPPPEDDDDDEEEDDTGEDDDDDGTDDGTDDGEDDGTDDGEDDGEDDGDTDTPPALTWTKLERDEGVNQSVTWTGSSNGIIVAMRLQSFPTYAYLVFSMAHNIAPFSLY